MHRPQSRTAARFFTGATGQSGGRDRFINVVASCSNLPASACCPRAQPLQLGSDRRTSLCCVSINMRCQPLGIAVHNTHQIQPTLWQRRVEMDQLVSKDVRKVGKKKGNEDILFFSLLTMLSMTH